jgi:hypothetical protein
MPRSIERALGALSGAPGETREQLLEADAAARALVGRMFAC